MLRLLDLFAGIAGFSLAAQMAGGYETVAFCEIDPFCRRVIAKNFPGVPIFEDIHELTAQTLRDAGIGRIDVVTGGFPCPPFSSAARGRKRNVRDHRWLWPQMRRVVSECRPPWVLCENVADIDKLALEEVCADLESIGYEVAPAFEIPACAVDADHIRRRIWILGHTNRHSQPSMSLDAKAPRLPGPRDDAGIVGATDGLSGRLDGRRMSALGNAIHPAVAAEFFRAISQCEDAA